MSSRPQADDALGPYLSRFEPQLLGLLPLDGPPLGPPEAAAWLEALRLRALVIGAVGARSETLAELERELSALVRRAGEQGLDRLLPAPGLYDPAAIAAPLVRAACEDLRAGRPPAPAPLLDAAGRLGVLLARHGLEGVLLSPQASAEAARAWRAPLGGGRSRPASRLDLGAAVSIAGRLGWLALSRQRGGPAHEEGVGWPSGSAPADPATQVGIYSCLAALQPLLGRWPELTAQLPADPELLGPLGRSAPGPQFEDEKLERRIERVRAALAAPRRQPVTEVQVRDLNEGGMVILAPEREADGALCFGGAIVRAGGTAVLELRGADRVEARGVDPDEPLGRLARHLLLGRILQVADLPAPAPPAAPSRQARPREGIEQLLAQEGAPAHSLGPLARAASAALGRRRAGPIDLVAAIVFGRARLLVEDLEATDAGRAALSSLRALDLPVTRDGRTRFFGDRVATRGTAMLATLVRALSETATLRRSGDLWMLYQEAEVQLRRLADEGRAGYQFSSQSFAPDTRHGESFHIAASKALGLLEPDIRRRLSEELGRLLWLTESRLAGRPALPGSDEPLGDDQTAATRLLRLTQGLPMLRRYPELAALAHRHADRLARAFEDFSRADLVLVPGAFSIVDAAAAEALYRSRIALDHVALVEVGLAGIERIALTPDRRGPGDLKRVGVMLEHELGIAFGELSLRGNRSGGGARVELVMPSLEAAPARAFSQAVAGVCAILVRDLGGVEVREQQYVRERSEPSGLPEGTPVPDSRGREVAREVIGYLPRRVHVARERAGERGARQRPRAHAVAAHLMRLREGAEASPQAREYAAEVGLPLLEGYTVREAHVKGGTPAEREALGTEVRRWRSWSALDYLRALLRPALAESAGTGTPRSP